jgi:hypothetical protein
MLHEGHSIMFVGVMPVRLRFEARCSLQHGNMKGLVSSTSSPFLSFPSNLAVEIFATAVILPAQGRYIASITSMLPSLYARSVEECQRSSALSTEWLLSQKAGQISLFIRRQRGFPSGQLHPNARHDYWKSGSLQKRWEICPFDSFMATLY